MNYDQAGQPSPMLFGRYLRFPPRRSERRIYNTAIVEIREITVFGTIFRCTTSGEAIIRSGRRRLRPHERSIRNGPTSVEEAESSERIVLISPEYMKLRKQTLIVHILRAGLFDEARGRIRVSPLGSKTSRCPFERIESRKTSYNRIF